MSAQSSGNKIRGFGFKNAQLLVSAVSLASVGIYYGLYPTGTISKLFDFEPTSTDAKNILTSLMALYLGMSAFWIAGICNSKFWRSATITTIIFMGSLAVGRVVAIFVYGFPSDCFLIGTIAEILLAIWGILNLKKYGGDNV